MLAGKMPASVHPFSKVQGGAVAFTGIHLRPWRVLLSSGRLLSKSCCAMTSSKPWPLSAQAQTAHACTHPGAQDLGAKALRASSQSQCIGKRCDCTMWAHTHKSMLAVQPTCLGTSGSPMSQGSMPAAGRSLLAHGPMQLHTTAAAKAAEICQQATSAAYAAAVWACQGGLASQCRRARGACCNAQALCTELHAHEHVQLSEAAKWSPWQLCARRSPPLPTSNGRRLQLGPGSRRPATAPVTGAA